MVKQKIKFNTRSKFYESSLLSLNIEKAKKELGWYPTLSFNETLKFTSLWYENFFEKKKKFRTNYENSDSIFYI